MKLIGKKALVTGAARGIGRGCALELSRAGAEVAVNDWSRGELLEAVARELRGFGGKAVPVEGDVFVRSSCQRVVAATIEALGRIDIFVSNPSRNIRGSILEYDADAFDKVIQATLVSGFHMGQLVARHMVERGGGGKIIFISSVHVHIPFARSAAYNAGKAGLNHLSFTIANELTPHRINVNVIEPGWIDTPGEHEEFGTEVIQKMGPTLPWGRFGSPTDIGKATVFLASDDADYITGTSLLVDGGYRMRGAVE